jgi:hypothetical protein
MHQLRHVAHCPHPGAAGPLRGGGGARGVLKSQHTTTLPMVRAIRAIKF